MVNKIVIQLYVYYVPGLVIYFREYFIWIWVNHSGQGVIQLSSQMLFTPATFNKMFQTGLVCKTPKCDGHPKVQWSPQSAMVSPKCDGLRQSVMVFQSCELQSAMVTPKYDGPSI
jgi:hypothetical protein